MTTSTATLVGLTAIVMWSLLAALTVATGRIPPFQLLAMTFAIGACVGPLTWLWRPSAIRALRLDPQRLGSGDGVGLYRHAAAALDADLVDRPLDGDVREAIGLLGYFADAARR